MSPTSEKIGETRVFPYQVSAAQALEGKAEAGKLLNVLLQGGFSGGLKSLFLLRLDGLKDFFGGRWNDLKPRIYGLARAEIEKVLGEGGSCLRYDDAAYLAVFTGGDEAQWKRSIAAMAKAVQDRTAGALSEEWLVRVWRASAMAEEGIAFSAVSMGELDKAPSAPPIIEAEKPKAAPAGGRSRVLGDADLYFVPIWEVRQNQVFAYLCEPEWAMGDGSYVHENTLEADFKDKRLRRAVDLNILHKTRERLEELVEHNRLTSIIVPVHLDTLTDPAYRVEYLSECSDIVGSFRQYLCFEIICSSGASAGYAEAVAAIRPYCRDLFVRVSASVVSPEDLIDANVFAIVLDLRDDSRSEAEITKEMERFQDRISGRGIYSGAHGLATTSLSIAAICAGFDFVGSDAIASALSDWPMDDYLVKPIDLFKELLKQK